MLDRQSKRTKGDVEAYKAFQAMLPPVVGDKCHVDVTINRNGIVHIRITPYTTGQRKRGRGVSKPPETS